MEDTGLGWGFKQEGRGPKLARRVPIDIFQRFKKKKKRLEISDVASLY